MKEARPYKGAATWKAGLSFDGFVTEPNGKVTVQLSTRYSEVTWRMHLDVYAELIKGGHSGVSCNLRGYFDEENKMAWRPDPLPDRGDQR